MVSKKSMVYPIMKWHKKLSIIDKRILWSFFGLLVLILLSMSTVNIIREYSEDISPFECNHLIRKELMLSQSDSFIETLIAENQSLLYLLGIAVGLGWVLHGVGFKVVGR